MTDKECASNDLLASLSNHLKMNVNGFMVMRSSDKAIREAWAGLSELDRECAKILALVRVSHEIEAWSAALRRG